MADPVALLCLDAVDIVHAVEVVEQPLGVFRDAQHPLALLLANNGAAAALADVVDNLLVGQHALTGRAPVDRHLGLIGKAVLIKLQEDPLRPLEIFRVGGVDLAIPIEAVAQRMELLAEVFDVILRDDRGVDVVLDRIVFSRQTEGVVAHREENVLAHHAVLAGDRVHRGIGTRVADVQARARGIRELDQRVKLLLIQPCHSLIKLFLLPALLPFGFNGGKIVFHASASNFMGISVASFQRCSRS